MVTRTSNLKKKDEAALLDTKGKPVCQGRTAQDLSRAVVQWPTSELFARVHPSPRPNGSNYYPRGEYLQAADFGGCTPGGAPK